jgi:hypothetical protein
MKMLFNGMLTNVNVNNANAHQCHAHSVDCAQHFSFFFGNINVEENIEQR